MIRAEGMISNVAKKTGYSKCHVRNMMKRYSDVLSVEKIGGRWEMPAANEAKLIVIVCEKSGKRRRKGERG